MLAGPPNPVLVPAYAEPLAWTLALVAMWAEVRVVLWLLRRAGNDVRGLLPPLFGLNLATWFVLLVAVDRADRWGWPMALSLTLLELAVVLVEAALLHSATRGRLFTRALPVRPIAWRSALGISFAGNVVSVAVSLAVPAMFLALANLRR